MQVIELGSGARLETRVVSSLEIRAAQMSIPDPPVPKSYIKSRGVWEDNPMHPDYIAAQQRVAVERAEMAGIAMVKLGCRLLTPLPESDGWLRRIMRYGIAKGLKNYLNLDDEEDRKTLYVAVVLMGDKRDGQRLLEAITITEQEIDACIRTLGIMRNGEYIHVAPLRYSIETGIGAQAIVIGGYQLISPIDEYGACSDAGLSWLEWRQGNYTKTFMLETIALYRVRKHIESHANDAQQAEAERKSKK